MNPVTTSVHGPPVRISQPGEPTWEATEFFPRQGEWTEQDYLALDAGRLIELADGCLEPADGARPRGGGTRMAVEHGQARVLELPRVEPAAQEVRQPRVEDEDRDGLDDSPDHRHPIPMHSRQMRIAF